MEEVAHYELVSGEETTQHAHSGGPIEKGVATTEADGTKTINFSGSYSTKPFVNLTPELGSDVVSAKIKGWVGTPPPYTGMEIFVGGFSLDSLTGKPIQDALVHWMIWI